MRKLLAIAAIILCAVPALAQSSFKYNGLSYTSTGVAFANLTVTPPQTNGTSIYCSDCQVAIPCAGGGNGAMAQHVNGSWQCGAGAQGTISANAVLNGQTSASLNGVKNLTDPTYGAKCDGSTNDSTAIQAVLNAGGSITAPQGVTCMVGTMLIAGFNNTVVTGNFTIKALPTLAAGDIIKVTGANVTLRGITVDGNSANNTHGLFGIDENGATNFLIDGVTVQNTFGSGIDIQAGASGTVSNSVAAFCGVSTQPVSGSGITLSGPTGRVAIVNSQSHDNVLGFSAFPSGTAGQDVTDLTFDNDDFYSNSTDGWQLFSSHNTGGQFRHVALTNSRAYCNGWATTAGGVSLLSTNCTPGRFQTGTLPSPSTGIGFNMDSPSIGTFVETGNTSHDNQWDGFDNTPQLSGTVNTQNAASGGCAANCVTWVSGDKFLTTWAPGSYININAVWYKISSVQSITLLSLASAPGTQTGVAFIASGNIAATISGNTAAFNGPCVGAANGCSTFFQGWGFSDISRGTTYSGNTADNNYQAGFNILGGARVTLSGNSSSNNNRATGAAGYVFNTGFLVQDCFDVTTVGSQSTGTNEVNGLGCGNANSLTTNDNFQNASGPYSIGAGCSSNATNFLTNNGNFYNNITLKSTSFLPTLVFSGGGTDTVVGSNVGGQSFTHTLPAAAGTLGTYGNYFSAAGTPIPACSATYANQEYCVTDETSACTNGNTYVSGGTNGCWVQCNSGGTAWKVDRKCF